MLLKKNKDFTQLFWGRLISNCGDTIYTIVLSWYVLEVTKSPFYVGLLNFLIFIPNTFSFVFGKKIDTLSKKSLLIILELSQLLAILGVICGIALRDINPNLSLIIIYICIFIASTVGLNTYIVQDSLIPKIVSKNDLTKAEMYMSVAYNGTEYLFTAVTGILLSFISYIPLLLIDVFTFMSSIVLFRKITFKENIDTKNEESDLLGGIRFVLKNKVVFSITLGGAIVNFLFGGLNVYQLLIAKDIGNSSYYGMLISACAIGTLVGSTFVANFVLKKISLGQAFWIATAFFGIGIGSTAFIQSKTILLVLWFFSFVFLGITHVVQKPILQMEIPDKHLGEVFSAFYTITIPTLAIGSLLFGIIAEFLSWRCFLIVFEIALILVSIIYYSNYKLRNYNVPKKLKN